MTWILFTLLAATMQTFRNALQSKLSGHVNTSGVTLARFLFASPIVVVYLLFLYFIVPQAIPEFNLTFVRYVVLASILQIVATALMVTLFKQKNFAVGAGLAKSEALVAAVLGTLFFGSALTFLGWIGILIGAAAVFVLSGLNLRGNLSVKTVLIGLASGSSFALTSLYIREASLALNIGFPHGAAWVLLWVLLLQTVLLSIYIWFCSRETFAQLFQYKGTAFAISLTSCFGSIGWFTAMSLQYVAYVKTLGQIEVLLTILLSVFWLKQPIKKHEFVGLILISIAAVMVMWRH